MTITLHPDHMTATERLDEIAEILSVGAMRLLNRKSSRLLAEGGDSSVDFTADQSLYGGATNLKGSRQ